jgi:hypothetical protein
VTTEKNHKEVVSIMMVLPNITLLAAFSSLVQNMFSKLNKCYEPEMSATFEPTPEVLFFHLFSLN